jgi:hypothetical protein
VDAALIAEYASKFDNIAYEPIALERKELRDTYRCSQQINEQITYCRNQLENEEQLPTHVKEMWQTMRQNYQDELEKSRKKCSK